MPRLLLCLVLLAGCGAPTPPTAGAVSDDDETGDAYEPFDELGKADGVQIAKGPVAFAAACAPGDRVTIAAVGDLLLHGPLQKQAVRTTTIDRFRSLWRDVEPLLSRADVAYANLEGPTAAGVTASGKSVTDPGFVFDGVVYSSYPQFNYHPFLLDDLLASGIDVVSTANNHALDRRPLGIDRTTAALEAAGLPYTGTRARGSAHPWHTTTTSAGFTLAWLACTYATNGIPDPNGQVLDCFEQETELTAAVRDLARDAAIDAVIVTPHWGVEYNANPERSQVRLGHALLDAGATVVLGSHPHVTQPWERYQTADGRETFIIYSLGNFVSGQTSLARKSSLLVTLGLTRTDAGVAVNGVRYVPLYTSTLDSRLAVRPIGATGAADSRALTVKMFGLFNLDAPDAPLETTPQCDPAWTPAPR